MKIDRLLHRAQQEAERRRRPDIAKAVSRMTTEQLIELVYRNPSDDRVREILASVGALDLPEGG